MGVSASAWERAAACLPERIRQAVLRCGGDGEGVEEIRIRSGGLCTLTSNGRTLSCAVTAVEEEIVQTVEALCGGSVYAHADQIREGVIAGENGIRAPEHEAKTFTNFI